MPVQPPLLSPEVTDAVRRCLASDSVRNDVREALEEIVTIDTLSTPDLKDTAAREQRILETIERRAAAHADAGLRIRHAAILPEIEDLPQYTIPA
jgi:hypothetical protein